MTTEFVKPSNLTVRQPFCLIEHKGLFGRLSEELARAANELAHDPRGFLGGLFATADTKDQKRRRLIYLGLGGALLAHTALLVVMVVAGWHRIMESPKVAVVPPDYNVNWLDRPRSNNDSGTSPAPKGEQHVSGGGGQEHEAPPTVGTPPPSLPTPPIVRANPSTLQNPATLPVTPNIQGPEAPPPPRDAVPGVANGKQGEFSTGSGDGGGLGGKSGSGVGPGTGVGGPRGTAGNPGSPDGGGKIEGKGTVISSLSYNDGKPEGYVALRWTYRPTPVVTPEAQANKVSGTVLVIATFRADGTITDIELKNPVDFMTESALDSLKRSRFRPATINGIPITVFRVPVRIDIHF